ncbi:hypothetical protein Q9R20_06370 [Microbacterium sp. PRF11]|uniref:hypothetical protein n=1 Tax=Microbacterium sp. PRF11 TaxID=2962593 RepID=UPI00288233DE|nr:hypothetical protein [Microbacterium sp. PRF11]MDT0116612.1 hypothetical protein [Microbacterium sp. PRF11]
MPTYLVSYDLKAPGRDYEPVWTYLRASTHWRPLDSVWFIVTDKTAIAVRDDIRKLADATDQVMVVRVDGQAWATSGLGSGNAWMAAHVAP